LRPIPRILSLRRRDYASQVQIGEPSRRKTISGCSRAPDANRYGALPLSTTGYVRSQLAYRVRALVRVVGKPEVIQLGEKSANNSSSRQLDKGEPKSRLTRLPATWIAEGRS